MAKSENQSQLPLQMVEFTIDDESELTFDVTPEQVAEAVLYHTDWTVDTRLSQIERENIRITPAFQRRDAWTLSKKIRFIESIFLGLPIPQIVLAEFQQERGRFLVLDGKQRLLSIMQFTGKAPGDDKFHGFRLRKSDIEVDTKLGDMTYDEMLNDDSFVNRLRQFGNQTIRAVIVRGWPNEDFLYLVFVRLNTGSVQLSSQELRQALVPGEFTVLVDKVSSDSVGLRHLLGNVGPDFRMRDAELLLRYLAFQFRLTEYSGNLKKFLDDTARRFNKKWEKYKEPVQEQIQTFETALDGAAKIFGWKNVARRWLGSEYEPRLNRALLDVLAYYFSNPKILDAALSSAEEVVAAYQRLCLEHSEFQNSIGMTTKSLTATTTRFRLWGLALREVTHLQFEVPDLEDKRIVLAL